MISKGLWKQKDAVQTVAIKDHGDMETAFDAKLAAVNAARRDIQIAANTALTYTDPANADKRRLMKLPPNMPYNPGLGAPSA